MAAMGFDKLALEQIEMNVYNFFHSKSEKGEAMKADNYISELDLRRAYWRGHKDFCSRVANPFDKKTERPLWDRWEDGFYDEASASVDDGNHF